MRVKKLIKIMTEDMAELEQQFKEAEAEGSADTYNLSIKIEMLRYYIKVAQR